MGAAIPYGRLSVIGLDRGRTVSVGAIALGAARLPSDPVGTTSLDFKNVAVGSRYRIERLGDGSLATPTANAEGVAGTSAFSVLLDLYASGSANNDLRIKVRKSTSATKYLPTETQATLLSVAQPVFISQVVDPIA